MFFLPIFGEESYENLIINIAEDIKKKRNDHVNKCVDKKTWKNVWVFLKKLCKFIGKSKYFLFNKLSFVKNKNSEFKDIKTVNCSCFLEKNLFNNLKKKFK